MTEDAKRTIRWGTFTAVLSSVFKTLSGPALSVMVMWAILIMQDPHWHSESEHQRLEIVGRLALVVTGILAVAMMRIQGMQPRRLNLKAGPIELTTESDPAGAPGVRS